MDLDFLSREVGKLARQTGEFMRKERLSFDRGRVEQKAAHDYVSYVDKESERRIVKKLGELLPQAGFIAEEGTGSPGGKEYCWVVDPLDGTNNYIHDSVPYCVSIALRGRGETLLGVVYECCREELFQARKGGKAYLNGREIHVSDQDVLDQSFVMPELPCDAARYAPFALPLMRDLYGRVSGMRMSGSAAAEICYVAAGRFEAFVEAFLGPWDIAAAYLILRQAGGRMTDFDGNADGPGEREVLATNGKVHEELLKVIRRHKKLLEND